MRTTRVRRTSAALAALGLALATGVALLGPSGASASSHREAPLIAADPAVDNTDVYAFRSPDRPGYVTFVANFIPFEEPNGGPNFYPFATDAVYNINVDNNGDAKPDAVFRWKFPNIDKRGGNTFLYNNGPVTSIADQHLLFRQTYTLQSSFNGEPFRTRVANAPVAPSRVGPASMPNYAKLRNQAVTRLNAKAISYARKADALGTRNPGYLFHLGMIELSLGRSGDTRRDLSAALSLNPHFSPLDAPIATAALNRLGAR